MKVASTVASMRGTRSACCPVISMMSRTAVIGARAAPAKTAPHADDPEDPGGRRVAGSHEVPKAAPSVPPMNRDGANTPPTKPIPRVKEVASILATHSTSSSVSA